jgi:hypothetical protein
VLIGEAQSSLAQLVPEHTILFLKVLDDVLLLLVDPDTKGQRVVLQSGEGVT